MRADPYLPVSICNLSRINSLARILVNIIMAISIADNQKHQRNQSKQHNDGKSGDRGGDGSAKQDGDGEKGDKPSKSSGADNVNVSVKQDGSGAFETSKDKMNEAKKEKSEKEGDGEKRTEGGDEKAAMDGLSEDNGEHEEQFVNFEAMLRDLGQLEKVPISLYSSRGIVNQFFTQELSVIQSSPQEGGAPNDAFPPALYLTVSMAILALKGECCRHLNNWDAALAYALDFLRRAQTSDFRSVSSGISIMIPRVCNIFVQLKQWDMLLKLLQSIDVLSYFSSVKIVHLKYMRILYEKNDASGVMMGDIGASAAQQKLQQQQTPPQSSPPFFPSQQTNALEHLQQLNQQQPYGKCMKLFFEKHQQQQYQAQPSPKQQPLQQPPPPYPTHPLSHTSSYPPPPQAPPRAFSAQRSPSQPSIPSPQYHAYPSPYGQPVGAAHPPKPQPTPSPQAHQPQQTSPGSTASPAAPNTVSTYPGTGQYAHPSRDTTTQQNPMHYPPTASPYASYAQQPSPSVQTQPPAQQPQQQSSPQQPPPQPQAAQPQPTQSQQTQQSLQAAQNGSTVSPHTQQQPPPPTERSEPLWFEDNYSKFSFPIPADEATNGKHNDYSSMPNNATGNGSSSVAQEAQPADNNFSPFDHAEAPFIYEDSNSNNNNGKDSAAGRGYQNATGGGSAGFGGNQFNYPNYLADDLGGNDEDGTHHRFLPD